MVIRDLQLEDFEAVYRLDQTCYPAGIAYSRYALREFLAAPGVRAWVAEEEGGVVGFIIVRQLASDRGHIITLDVRQDRRRQHMGTKLLTTAEEWLAQQGVRHVRLETAVDNLAAVAFWTQAGYQTLAILPRYYLGRLDAYRMEKELG